MADTRKHSSTSNLIRFTLKHATTGFGLTGLSSASTGLIISTITDNEATATTYTVAGSTVETITTLGTYAAPTATKCRFKEVDATNHKGLYEFQFADARFSVASAKRLVISVTGATNLLDADYEIQLVQFDPYDSVRMGMTALPNAAAEAAGGLYTRGTGAGQIAQDANGNIRTNVDTIKTQAVTCAAGVTVLASVGTATTSTAQTGDSFGRIGANGSGLTDLASAANLATVAGYIDTEVASILTAIVDATSGLAALNTDLDTLLSRLTAARAGYLDNLSGGAVALASALATALTALTDLQARLPAALVGGRLKSLVEAYATGQDPATLLLVTPANKLATDATGKVTVDDKTGYSLAADQAVNVTKINGSADAAAQLGRSAATIANGAAIAGVLTTTEMTTNLTFAAPEQMNGRILIFAPDTVTAALRKQATNITGTMASGKLTFTALTTAPVIGDTFVIV